MKLCKDCKHYRDIVGDKCHRPSLGINLVTGNQYWNFCHDERNEGWFITRLEGMCGREGRYFEAKNSDLNKST